MGSGTNARRNHRIVTVEYLLAITLGVGVKLHHRVEWGDPWFEVWLRRHFLEESLGGVNVSDPRASANNCTVTDGRRPKAVCLHLGERLHQR